MMRPLVCRSLTCPASAAHVWSVAVTPDGKRAAADETTIRVWNLEAYKELASNSDHTRSVRGLAVSADGKSIVTASFDGTVRQIGMDGKQIRQLTGHPGGAWFAAVAPDGSSVATCGVDGAVRLHDLKSGKLLRTLEAHVKGSHAIAFSPDGTRLVSGGLDNKGRVWDVGSGALLQTLAGHADWVSCAGFVGNQAVLTGSADRTLRLWKLRH